MMTPEWSTAADIDYAGNEPTDFVRIGADSGCVNLIVYTIKVDQSFLVRPLSKLQSHQVNNL